MPKTVKPLTDKEIKAAKPGMHADGGGLYLSVQAGGGKSWILRYTWKVGDKVQRREMGLGALEDLPATKARAKANELRQQVLDGVDPIQKRDSDKAALAAQEAAAVQASTLKAATFATVASDCIEANKAGWRNAKHVAQWTTTLKEYAFPFIGDKPVNEVTRADVLRVLQQPVTLDGKPPVKGALWALRNETASRVRGRIEKVLDYAEALELRAGKNPAVWRNGLDAVLSAPSKTKRVIHQPALPIDKLPAFMAALRAMPGTAARALEFAILTAARSGEVRGAKWSEIDLEDARWVVPDGRMKARKEHHVALSPAAVELLKAQPRVDNNELVFPAPRGKQFSDMALLEVVRRMNGKGQPGVVAQWVDKEGVEVVPHGFRSTFRDWAGELSGHAREVIEHAMAHQLKDKAEAAYARGTAFDKRRVLMADWANQCHKDNSGKVIPLRRIAA